MNIRVWIALTCAMAATTSLPAVAGRDAAQVMQQDRANRLATQERALQQADCDTAVGALPLDHGPRADTTPWANQQLRKQRISRCKGKIAERAT